MHLLNFFSICLTLGSTATATAAKPKSTKTSTSSYSYLLQTHVIKGGRSDFDGLYVQSYHTGAGTSDATLGKNKDVAVRGELINGTQYFEIGDFPWSFNLPQPITYDAWYPVSLDGGVYTTDLFLNSTGLQWTEDESFGGWLVCQWSHGVPQLFWKVNYYNYPLPVCAQVELRPVAKGKLFKLKGL